MGLRMGTHAREECWRERVLIGLMWIYHSHKRIYSGRVKIVISGWVECGD
jgi:hypothetical protein